MIIIPFKDNPSFREEISISGIPYIFEFNWNSRGEYWTISVYNRDELPLLLGVKLVIFYELVSRFVDRGLPRGGEMYIIDPSGTWDKIAQDDFQSRLYLIYFEEGELVSV